MHPFLATGVIWDSLWANIIGGLVVAAILFLIGRAMLTIRDYRRMHTTVDTLVRDVAQVKEDVRAIRTETEKQSPNGRDTNNTGDLVYRMAKKLGVALDDSDG